MRKTVLPIFVPVVVTIFTDDISYILNRGHPGTKFLRDLEGNVYPILSPSRVAEDSLPTERYQCCFQLLTKVMR